MALKRLSREPVRSTSLPEILVPLQPLDKDGHLQENGKEAAILVLEDTECSALDGDLEATPLKPRYNRRQWTFFLVICFINMCAAMCYSLQAPFYPREAEKKGMSATVYGLVFGVFELVDFIFCPIYGKFIRQIGPKFMLNAGNFLMGSCVILFGMLDRTPYGTPFIALSFAIRIVEAMGQAGYLTAVFAIIAHEFPESIASTFSILQTTFGVGMIIGPTVGGVLYEADGYYLPFLVVGGCLLFTALITTLILPTIEETKTHSSSVLRLLVIPSIVICYYSVFAVAFSYGFTAAILEPHVRQFNLTPAVTGLLFIINGTVYAITAAAWGYMADKHVHPKILCGAGGIIISVAFLLLGPAPFFNTEPTLWLVIVALILHGVGTGGEYVAAFLDCSQSARNHGFPDNIETYGLIAGLWASGLALGSFVGPSIAGAMTDAVGFRSSTMLVVALHVVVVFLSFGFLLREKFWNRTPS